MSWRRDFCYLIPCESPCNCGFVHRCWLFWRAYCADSRQTHKHTCLHELKILADQPSFSSRFTCKWGIFKWNRHKQKARSVLEARKHDCVFFSLLFNEMTSFKKKKRQIYLWMMIQQYTRPPRKWCMYNLVIFFFIIIAIISVLVQLLHNDSHSRYFVTQEQLKGIKTKKINVYCQK